MILKLIKYLNCVMYLSPPYKNKKAIFQLTQR